MTIHSQNSKFLVLLISISSINSLSLDDSGFYKIVVAIDERTAQNSVEGYVDKIKSGIQDLSDLLHHTTKNKFSISQADILVPSHWNVVGVETATTQYYTNADIKISHTFLLPHVNNPNACGLPGEDIQIPYPFFDLGDRGTYGRLGKALLNQFARLRFGVWEEHGFPGDSMFPYFWKQLSGNDWEINACTDEPVQGQFKNINDDTDCRPNSEDNLYPPPNECRFIPSISQTAKSSIMSYHYLPTFESFCNYTTHDREKPTPQNAYCKYKSIMEVIETSQDWTSVTKENGAGRVNFKVVKNSVAPLLYILLDAGITSAPDEVLTEISSRLTEFITLRELRNVVAALGTFPGDNSVYSEVVPWTHLRQNTQEFIVTFNTTFGIKPGFRNYAGALKEIVNNFNERKHKPGGVVLVVKTGAEANYGGLAPESDVLISLLQTNLKIFAIEVQSSSIQPGIALERVVEKSSGIHLPIRTLDDLKLPFSTFMSTLTQTVQSEIKLDRKYVLVMKEFMPNNAKLYVSANTKIEEIEAFATVFGEDINPHPSFNFLGEDGVAVADVNLTRIMDWDTTSGSNKNYHATKTYIGDARDFLFWDQFKYGCPSGNCRVLLIILAKLEDPEAIPWDVNIKVWTSARNNLVDLYVDNAISDIGTPFAIYAKLDQESIPITPIPAMVVTAIISLSDGSTFWTVELKDDGKRIPDVSTNDGIFSGSFVPPADGLYNILVTVIYRVPPEPSSTTQESVLHANSPFGLSGNMLSSSVGKLFPVDQVEIGCGSGYLGCWSRPPDVEFVVSQELRIPVEVINFNSYIMMVHRIIDLVVVVSDDNLVDLQWTSPGFQDHRSGDGEYSQADEYEIRHQDTLDKLLANFSSAENVPLRNLFPARPGTRQNLTYNFGREDERYYAIKTIIMGTPIHMEPIISNIVGVRIRENVVTTTTTFATTIRPSTSTTTMIPTSPTSPGTTEDDFATTTVTTPRTTQLRTTPTTQRTHAPTTTPTIPTTQEPTEKPRKHWFQEKEGIITLSVFGAGFLLLLVGGLVFVYITKYR